MSSSLESLLAALPESAAAEHAQDVRRPFEWASPLFSLPAPPQLIMRTADVGLRASPSHKAPSVPSSPASAESALEASLSLYCDVCKKKFASEATLGAHLKSAKHLKEAKARADAHAPTHSPRGSTTASPNKAQPHQPSEATQGQQGQSHKGVPKDAVLADALYWQSTGDRCLARGDKSGVTLLLAAVNGLAERRRVRDVARCLNAAQDGLARHFRPSDAHAEDHVARRRVIAGVQCMTARAFCAFDAATAVRQYVASLELYVPGAVWATVCELCDRPLDVFSACDASLSALLADERESGHVDESDYAFLGSAEGPFPTVAFSFDGVLSELISCAACAHPTDVAKAASAMRAWWALRRHERQPSGTAFAKPAIAALSTCAAIFERSERPWDACDLHLLASTVACATGEGADIACSVVNAACAAVVADDLVRARRVAAFIDSLRGDSALCALVNAHGGRVWDASQMCAAYATAEWSWFDGRKCAGDDPLRDALAVARARA